MRIGGCEYGSGSLRNDRRGPENYRPTFVEDSIPYRELLELVPAVLYVDASDESSSAIYMSPQVEGMLGYAPEEWIANPALWVELLHSEDRERVLDEHERTRQSGEPFSAEYRLLRRDGRTVWMRDKATPVLDDNGRPTRWQGVMLDVTDRKEAEEAFRRSEERYRLGAKATGEAIWDNDLTTGEQQWAGATEALFGYPAHVSNKGEWWEERIHPDDRNRVLSSLRAVYGGGESWPQEYRFRRANGEYAIVVDRGHVVRDEEGRPRRMVGSMADVTERRRWEETLRESEKRFNTTFDAAAVGMAHVALDGSWLRVNDKLCEISGYGREELIGMTFMDLTPPEDLESSRERMGSLIKGDLGSYSMERRYVRKNGSRVWVELSVSLERKLSGEPDYIFCVAEDITARKVGELVPDALTSRELEVLHYIVAGLTNRQIAKCIAHSVGTVKLDVQSVLRKLGVENRRRAVSRAVKIGLLPPHPARTP